MDEGTGLGESSAQGSAEVRLCNLVAQSEDAAEGSISTGGGAGADRGGQRTAGACLFQALYKSQIAIIEQALETAALMLGSDRSRGYCLEMICADFLAGANLNSGDPETLLFSMVRFFRLLPETQRKAFLAGLGKAAA
jgi:hypothetical protein